MVICSLFTTRFALRALGIVDFGLYSVLGGIISFMVLFNTIMVSTSHRFIAVSIGKDNRKETSKQFNVNLVIHTGIAVITFVVAIPVGNWYIYNFINYEGSILKAVMIFDISMLASVISFIGVPYNALLMAKERFIVFTSVEILCNIIKLLIAYSLLYFFTDKLFMYAVSLAFLTVIPVLFNFIYCTRNYPEIVKLQLVKEWERYREVFSFSLWVSIGAVAMVGKNQGAALLVNNFFNTIMNTALGVANNVTSFLKMFSRNVIQPMAPQITKSYAAGNYQRTNELLMMSTRYAFLLMLLASSPFIVEPEWILKIWLGEVPPYAVNFLSLLVVENLIFSFNAGISNVIFASGKIKWYQIITSVLNIMSIVVGYFYLREGVEAYKLLYVYILCALINVIVVQLILHFTLHLDNVQILKHSYLPSILVSLLFLPIVVVDFDICPVISIVVALVYLLVVIYFVGLKKNERVVLLNKLATSLKYNRQ